MTTDVQNYLEAHLHNLAAPFLFVGSGLSRRFVKTEGWEDLLRLFAEQTGTPYEYYRSSAGGDLPRVASILAEAYHEIWWREDRFSQAREAWGTRIKGRDSALKVEISFHLAEMASNLPMTGVEFDELELLRNAVVDGVITTNYDPMLEAVFPDFRTFVGQDEMLFTNPQGIGEIYKIHGSCSDPDSLVLTEADYQRFEKRNPYLAAKLLTIFVEHPVLFLGYSLSDSNVASILRSIARCLTQENLQQLEDRLIFVQWNPNTEPTVSSHTMMIGDFIIPVQRIVVPDYLGVFGALTSLKRAFPARLLRRLKEQVYELVLNNNDKSQQIVVADIDDNSSEGFDVVFGVGMNAKLSQRGYVGLDRWSLLDDVVTEGSSFDPVAVIEFALPKILRAPGNVPVFKYLSQAGFLAEDGSIQQGVKLPPEVVRLAEKNAGGLSTGEWHKAKSAEKLQGITGIHDLGEKRGLEAVRDFAVYMPIDLIDPEELRQFILRRHHDRNNTWNGTQYAKLTCFYDWLTYGLPTESKHHTGDAENQGGDS